MSAQDILIDTGSEEEYREKLWESLEAAVLERSGPEARYLMKQMGPTLVQCLEELVIAYEKEKAKNEAHNKLMKKNPSMPRRPAFNPLLWLASHMMQYNPKHPKLEAKVKTQYSFGKKRAEKIKKYRPRKMRPMSASTDVTEFEMDITIDAKGGVDVGLNKLPKYDVGFSINEDGGADVAVFKYQKKEGSGLKYAVPKPPELAEGDLSEEQAVSMVQALARASIAGVDDNSGPQSHMSDISEDLAVDLVQALARASLGTPPAEAV